MKRSSVSIASGYTGAWRSGEAEREPGRRRKVCLSLEERAPPLKRRAPVRRPGPVPDASGLAQHPGGDHQALDFAGAFVNFGDARVAVHAFDGVFTAVAVAAV